MSEQSSTNGPWNRSLAVCTVLALVCAGLVFWLARSPIINRLEYLFWDYRFQIRGGEGFATDSVVIVEIDERSYPELGKPEDWPRAYHARLVSALKDLGAKAIAFDIDFFKPSPKGTEDDAQFAQSMRQAGNVVLSVKQSPGEVRQGGKAPTLKLPVEPLRSFAAGLGLADMQADGDGSVRSALLFIRNGETLYPCLGFQAVALAFGERECDIRFDPETGIAETCGMSIPCRKTIPIFPINFAGPANTFTIVPYEQLLTPTGVDELAHDGAIQGSVVLVGSVLPGRHDFYTTPFSYKNREKTSGVEIHANIARNLLAGDFVERSGALSDLLILVGISLLTAVFVNRYKPLPSLPLCILLAILFTVIGITFFLWKRLMLANAGPILAVFLTYLASTGYQVLTRHGKAR